MIYYKLYFYFLCRLVNIYSAQFYPCKECGSNFYNMLEEYPVKARSRKELMPYMCELHNEFNKKLRKPIFDCAHVEEKWDDFTREELGNHGWHLLHLTTGNYPEKATLNEQRNFEVFLKLL